VESTLTMASNFQERELSISGSTPSIRFVWAAQIGLTIRILGVLVQCNERMYNVNGTPDPTHTSLSCKDHHGTHGMKDLAVIPENPNFTSGATTIDDLHKRVVDTRCYSLNASSILSIRHNVMDKFFLTFNRQC